MPKWWCSPLVNLLKLPRNRYRPGFLSQSSLTILPPSRSCPNWRSHVGDLTLEIVHSSSHHPPLLRKGSACIYIPFDRRYYSSRGLLMRYSSRSCEFAARHIPFYLAVLLARKLNQLTSATDNFEERSLRSSPSAPHSYTTLPIQTRYSIVTLDLELQRVQCFTYR